MLTTGLKNHSVAILERHPRLPLLFLVVLPFIVHLPQWLLPIHNDPFWYLSFLARGVKHTWLPGQAYLDPYVGFTSQSLGPLIARDWLHGIVPWWNPNVGIGVPLAGQMQPGVFFLPFVLLLALPGGLTLLTIAVQIVCGLSTYGLLRELQVSKLAALTGGALYALNGTVAWVPGPAAVFCTLAFLPLLLWGIERARRERQGAAAILAISVAIAWSLFAGFPETAYLDGLLGLSWALYRIASSPKRWMLAQRVIIGGTLGVLLAAPLLIAFAHEMASTDLLTGHIFGSGSMNLRALPMLLMPTVYGPINSGAAGGAGMAEVWGGIGGYSGALIAFFAVLSFTGRAPERGLRLLLLSAILLTLGKTFGFSPAVITLNAIPMMKVVAFYRYASPCWEIALIILAAFGVDALRAGRGVGSALLITVCLVSILIILAWPARKWSSLPGLWMSVLLIISGVWAMALPLITWLVRRVRTVNAAHWIAASLLIVDSTVMFCLPQCVGLVGGELNLSAVRFLQTHAGLSRVVTLGPLAPNYGAYFGFSELNHNMSPVPKKWLDHINDNLLPNFVAVDGGVTFWPIKNAPLDGESAVAALHQHLPDYQQLDVKYAVTYPGQDLATATLMEVPAGSKTVYNLVPGQEAAVRIKAQEFANPIQQVGVFIGTYGGSSNGILHVKLCSDEGGCRSGHSALSGAQDNAVNFVLLDAPLPVVKGSVLRLNLNHEGGTQAVALWTWPGQQGDAQLVDAAGGKSAAAVRLGFRDAAQSTLGKRVFTSKSADIWGIPDAQPYFDTKGTCKLDVSGREILRANCPHEAVLVRREFFMSGWSAQVNGMPAPVKPHNSVLQEIQLPRGFSEVRFQFSPPYIAYGWLACLTAAMGIAWQVFRMWKMRSN